MIRFRMLGTVDLRDDQERDANAVLRRPKLLGLLCYLAAARPRGFQRRDALVALFWPELDNAHARNALRQSVHALRGALGPGALSARGEEELGLSAERLWWCDVWEFDARLEGGQRERALDLYRGELLQGLHVSDAPDFERWLESEREQLRRRACEVVAQLTDDTQATGDPAVAARWARRLTDLAPFDETAARRLIEALDRLGDRAGAVQAYENFERRLSRDLEVQPSPETRELIRSIRARQQHNGAPALLTPTVGKKTGTTARARRNRAATVLLVLGGLLGGGFLLVRGHARSAEEALLPRRVAVLPFTHLGAPEEQYFTDGVTEEITARLAAIGRLRVIAATTGNAYRNTTKTIPEIGKELGADYILEGSVRWERLTGGRARVRITPQLVKAADGTHVWAEIYEEPLDEIFSVQSDVAHKVILAMDVTLLEPERRLLEAKPTGNLQAYDDYLRGLDYMRRGPEERVTRAALRMFEKAVQLDSAFALAYARLSQMHSRMYWFYYDHSEDRLVNAKRAVDRAFALDPRLPEAHLALGAYHFLGHLDYERALREYDAAAAGRPNASGVFLDRAAVFKRQGNLRASLENFKRAFELDPGSTIIASTYAQTYDLLRDFPNAEAVYERTITLSPDWANAYFLKAAMYLRWQGSTAKARAVLEEARAAGVGDQPQLIFTRVLVEMFDRRYRDAITLLSTNTPRVISDQFRFVPRAQLYAQVYGLMNNPVLERAYYDSARTFLLQQLRTQPDDPRLHSALGIAYAGLGRRQDAIAEGEKAVALMPISKEAYRGYYREWDLARIYVKVGDQQAAIERLEHLLSIPGHLTVAWLRIDPTWEPLRGDPRFQTLLARAMKPVPVRMPDGLWIR